jgi:hypothetical protein
VKILLHSLSVAIANVDNASVNLLATSLENVPAAPALLSAALSKHYLPQLVASARTVPTSWTVFSGNVFWKHIYAAITDAVTLPALYLFKPQLLQRAAAATHADAALMPPLLSADMSAFAGTGTQMTTAPPALARVILGIRDGIEGFCAHVAYGTLYSTSNFLASIAKGLHVLALDLRLAYVPTVSMLQRGFEAGVDMHEDLWLFETLDLVTGPKQGLFPLLKLWVDATRQWCDKLNTSAGLYKAVPLHRALARLQKALDIQSDAHYLYPGARRAALMLVLLPLVGVVNAATRTALALRSTLTAHRCIAESAAYRAPIAPPRLFLFGQLMLPAGYYPRFLVAFLHDYLRQQPGQQFLGFAISPVGTMATRMVLIATTTRLLVLYVQFAVDVQAAHAHANANAAVPASASADSRKPGAGVASRHRPAPRMPAFSTAAMTLPPSRPSLLTRLAAFFIPSSASALSPVSPAFAQFRTAQREDAALVPADGASPLSPSQAQSPALARAVLARSRPKAWATHGLAVAPATAILASTGDSERAASAPLAGDRVLASAVDVYNAVVGLDDRQATAAVPQPAAPRATPVGALSAPLRAQQAVAAHLSGATGAPASSPSFPFAPASGSPASAALPAALMWSMPEKLMLVHAWELERLVQLEVKPDAMLLLLRTDPGFKFDEREVKSELQARCRKHGIGFHHVSVCQASSAERSPQGRPLNRYNDLLSVEMPCRCTPAQVTYIAKLIARTKAHAQIT